eukprot:jgi/Undpi1/5952/HiC_scaffold_2.g01226.m1
MMAACPPQLMPPRSDLTAGGGGGMGGGGMGGGGNRFRGPLNIPENPPRLPRRPPRKGNKRETLQDIARRVPVEIIRPYFNYPLRAAADALCISVTTLKRLCRRHGVKRWPHRQLSGLNRAVSHLEAKQEASGDPVIADQLRQLYSRRDVVIDLAFMSDDDAPEPNNPTSRPDGGKDFGVDRVDDLSPHPTPSHSPVRPYCGVPQDTMIPWWHREPPVSGPWQRNDANGFGMGDGGLSMKGMGGELADCGRGGDDLSRDGGGPGREGCEAGGGGQGNFRASSVLVRLPGMAAPPLPPASSALRLHGRMDQHQANPMKIQTRVGVFPSMNNQPQMSGQGVGGAVTAAAAAAAAAAAVAAGGASANGDMLRRNLSPITVGRPGKTYIAGAGNNGRAAHFVPMPPHHPSESIDMQVTELAALNDILFGPEGEDPGLMHARAAAAAAAAAGGMTFDRQKGLTLAALEPSGIRSAAPQRCAGIDAGGSGTGNENGRLPSIAGLVAAGALLNGGEWRSCRQPGSFAYIGPQAKCD